MTKASQHDFDTLLDFLNNLEEKVEDSYECSSHDIGEWVVEQFGKVIPCWGRVIWGYDTLATNAADPDLTYLDWKPEIKAAIEMYEANTGKVINGSS